MAKYIIMKFPAWFENQHAHRTKRILKQCGEHKLSREISAQHDLNNASKVKLQIFCIPEMVPGTETVYRNNAKPCIDFAFSRDMRNLLLLGMDLQLRIIDSTSWEIVCKVFNFNGMRLILPDCFDLAA